MQLYFSYCKFLQKDYKLKYYLFDLFSMLFFVHCRIKPGGALNVLESLIQKEFAHWLSVDAIFTMYSDREFLNIQYKDSTKKIPIITALPCWLNRLFRRADEKKPLLISSLIDYRNLMPLFPELMEILSWKLEYMSKKLISDKQTNKKKLENKIIISSYAVAKNIHIPDWYQSTIYFHQPMHYIWTLYDAYVWSMTGWKKKLYQYITPRLRRRDAKPRSYDIIYANSESTKKQIKKIYFPLLSPQIEVIHPPIEPSFFHETIMTKPDNYFFYINRLTKLFKHLDRIILLCNKYKVPLIIAGDGPDKAYLQSLAWPTITFVWWVSNIEDKISLIKKSRGILNIAHESFGIVTAEALLLWVPVFGYDGWATPELVDTKSGILSPSVEVDAMSPYFEKFLMKEWDRQYIQDHARKLLTKKQEFWKI